MTDTITERTAEAPHCVFESKDFASGAHPVWCPGCGDFGVLAALERALAKHGRPPHEIVLVSGIGCSSRLPGYMSTYGFHGVHGRALAAATGLKLTRPDLEVIVVGGDGDGYSIGGNHFIHACRRNVDMLYVVMDNRVYGMTKGQPSPTTEADWDSDIAPGGIGLRPFNPLAVAIASGANYVARGFSGDPNGLADLILDGLRVRGRSNECHRTGEYGRGQSELVHGGSPACGVCGTMLRARAARIDARQASVNSRSMSATAIDGFSGGATAARSPR